jgi:hypothetical protein
MLRRFASLNLLTIACATACSASKSDDEPKTVPADIKPEDATFRIVSRTGGGGTRKVLAIRLSTVSFCDRRTIADKQSYVQVNVVVPSTSDFPAATYGAGFDGESEIVLSSTSGTQCSGSSGGGVSRGAITLTQVAPSEVRGSFQGTNTDTNIDLKGTFIAKACADESIACLL